MTTRLQQRDATRARILKAAVKVFTEKGFHGASTRDIAGIAKTNQGLITYHFSSKEALWRAAADSVFDALDQRLKKSLEALDATEPREYTREVIREYVRFTAENPELFRLMVDEGKVADKRMKWLVDNHIKPRFDVVASELCEMADLDQRLIPHVFYALAGASSLIFAVAPECRRLTGLNPRTADAIETHAEFIANLIVPTTPA
jgi:AcrR family transcriptional regulator